jgi:hypothetical protein
MRGALGVIYSVQCNNPQCAASLLDPREVDVPITGIPPILLKSTFLCGYCGHIMQELSGPAFSQPNTIPGNAEGPPDRGHR